MGFAFIIFEVAKLKSKNNKNTYWQNPRIKKYNKKYFESAY